MSNSQQMKKGLSVRDLITTGILAALYMVCAMIGEATTVFDGELDATDVFVSLISQKYGKTNAKEYLAKKKDISYNEDEVQKSQIPSGLCG